MKEIQALAADVWLALYGFEHCELRRALAYTRASLSDL